MFPDKVIFFYDKKTIVFTKTGAAFKMRVVFKYNQADLRINCNMFTA